MFGSTRVVAHVDLDAFYAQVEAQRRPELRGQPLAVVQYNPFGDLATHRPEDDDRLLSGSGASINQSIIAVNYEARKHGVKRNMMGQQARKLCPQLHIVQVPTSHGKADLTLYREAGAQVMAVLGKQCVCERASIDECYLDLTDAAAARVQQLMLQAQQAHAVLRPPSYKGIHVCLGQEPPAAQHAAASTTSSGEQEEQPQTAAAATEGADATGTAAAAADPTAAAAAAEAAAEAARVAAAAAAQAWWQRPPEAWTPQDRLLASGAAIVAELRAAVLQQLGYTCSAGIAHYKILAKLGSGLHKPMQQTVVPAAAVPALLGPLPIPKLRQLGGKFGENLMDVLGISTVGELAAVPLARLQAAFGEDQALWLHRLSRGIDSESVKQRMLPKGVGCSKTFRGRNALGSLAEVHKWLKELAGELEERLEADRQANQRMPQTLTVSIDEHKQPAGAAAAANGAGGAAGGSPNAGWRANVQGSSRACPLRRATAEAMADDALALVRKWAAGRPNWSIIGLGLSATNFTFAPTGASTMLRYLQPNKQQQHQPEQQQQEQEELEAQQQQRLLQLQEDEGRPAKKPRIQPQEQEELQQQQQQQQHQQHQQQQAPQGGREHKRSRSPEAHVVGQGPDLTAGGSASSNAGIRRFFQAGFQNTSSLPTPPAATAAAQRSTTVERGSGGNMQEALRPSAAGVPPRHAEQHGSRIDAAEAGQSLGPGGSDEQQKGPSQPPGQSQEVVASLSGWLPSQQQAPQASASQQHFALGSDVQPQLLDSGPGELQGQPAPHQLQQRRPAGSSDAGNSDTQAGAPVAFHQPQQQQDQTQQQQASGIPQGWHTVAGADIDHAVLAELPHHLQQEILREMRLAGGGGHAAGQQRLGLQQSRSSRGGARGRRGTGTVGTKRVRGRGARSTQKGALDAFVARK